MNLDEVPQFFEQLMKNTELIIEMLKQQNQPNEVQVEYLTLERMIKYLADQGLYYSKSKIYKLSAAKAIPHRKVNRRLIFRKQDVDLFISQCMASISNNSTFKIAESARKRIN